MMSVRYETVKKVLIKLKKVVILGAVLIAGVLLVLPAVPTKAAGSDGIKSYGVLHIEKEDGSQSIHLYASDIHYLQAELDALFAELP